MALVTKFKITNAGKMTAGQFVEDDETTVRLSSDSIARSSGLDETGDHVKFMSDGTLVAAELEEI